MPNIIVNEAYRYEVVIVKIMLKINYNNKCKLSIEMFQDFFIKKGDIILIYKSSNKVLTL